jgi:hypothetical protein
MLRILSSFVICSAFALAQEPAVPATPAEPQGPTLPQANSEEARQLLSTALDKTAAYARGHFATTESQDSAMLRNAGLPIGAQDVEVQGGWNRNLVWADWDGREYMLGNGRMLAKIDGNWRMRRNKLSGGIAMPFTLDPDYLVTVLKQLPKAAGNVVHVEAGKLRSKDMVLLTIKLENEAALEFADAGAVPDAGGGFGGVMMLGGLGGLGGEPPRPELQTYMVFYVDADSGDLARLVVKTYQTDPMMGQIQIAAGGFGGNDEDEEEEDDEAEPANGEVKWKRGLPSIKPTKEQSVMNFRADFSKLGMAEAPELDAQSKALLRVR